MSIDKLHKVNRISLVIIILLTCALLCYNGQKARGVIYWRRAMHRKEQLLSGTKRIWRLLVARSKRSKPTDSRRIAQRLARLQMQSCVITFSTALEKSRTRNNVLTNLLTRLRAREVERAICSDPTQKPTARA